jgi:DNA modification methylase
MGGFSRDRNELLAAHPTVKPSAMIADAIRDCSKRGGIVLDGFAGSGTIFIAAEKTARRGYGIELDPRYADVCVKRWQKFTAKEAVLLKSGQTFNEVAVTRSNPNGETSNQEEDTNV